MQSVAEASRDFGCLREYFIEQVQGKDDDETELMRLVLGDFLAFLETRPSAADGSLITMFAKSQDYGQSITWIRVSQVLLRAFPKYVRAIRDLSGTHRQVFEFLNEFQEQADSYARLLDP